MLWAVAGAKGGVGTSTIATSIAVEAARYNTTLLVDLAGDQPDMLGVKDSGRGVLDWLAASADVDVDVLERLRIPVTERLDLVPRGRQGRPMEPGSRIGELVEYLRVGPAIVVADLGVAMSHPSDWRAPVLAGADRRTLVVRACYLTLRRARDLPFEFDDIVEVSEAGRALTTTDIEGVLMKPVSVRLPVDPTVARAVDAGLLARRPPRRLRGLRALTQGLQQAST